MTFSNADRPAVTPLEVIVSAIWALLLVAALPRVRSVWKGGEALANVERFWRRVWPYSENALQGWLRAQAALYVAACFMAVYPAAVLFRAAPQSTRPILALVTLAGITGALLMFGTAIAIILFNVPKRVAIPALRHQEGLLARWWRLRRAAMPKQEQPRTSDPRDIHRR